MNGSAWIPLLRRIPADQVEKLCLVTTTGTELSLQSIVRMEEEFLVVRARISGSSDTGRAFFIPYDQVNFLGFTKSVREEEVQALFDGPGQYVPVARVVPDLPGMDHQPAHVPPEATPVQPPPPAAPPPTPAADARPLPTKSKVLANLRARLKSGPGSGFAK
jgi:hypothetical protein